MREPVFSTVWAVYIGGDDRRMGEPKYWFTTKEQADESAKGAGWYGGNAPVVEHPSVTIWYEDGDPNTYILHSAKPVRLGWGRIEIEEAKKKALAKLTPFEKSLLELT